MKTKPLINSANKVYMFACTFIYLIGLYVAYAIIPINFGTGISTVSIFILILIYWFGILKIDAFETSFRKLSNINALIILGIIPLVMGISAYPLVRELIDGVDSIDESFAFTVVSILTSFALTHMLVGRLIIPTNIDSKMMSFELNSHSDTFKSNCFTAILIDEDEYFFVIKYENKYVRLSKHLVNCVIKSEE
ncbi:MAG: hypothetical protein IBX70_11735 [Clostridia bacterium]|nr:hypothetical protein [Clostridia bacterium]